MVFKCNLKETQKNASSDGAVDTSCVMSKLKPSSASCGSRAQQLIKLVLNECQKKVFSAAEHVAVSDNTH